MTVSRDTPGQDFYRDAMDLLDRAGVPFLVGGAFCLSAYTGIVRDTKDFDLMLCPEDLGRALDALRAAGFRAEIVFPHWLAKAHHGEAFIDLIFSSGNGICRVDREWFAHARRAKIFGRDTLICPPEEVLWQKAYIMERERFDGADVAHLLLSCADALDWERLLRRFGSDWQVLASHLLLFSFIYPARSALVPERILARLLARRSGTPSREGDNLCNGTLLSRAQYLPDVERWGYADPRVGGRNALTPEERELWTNAIPKTLG